MSNLILMVCAGYLAPSVPVELALEVRLQSRCATFLVVPSAHSRRLTRVNFSSYLVDLATENDWSAGTNVNTRADSRADLAFLISNGARLSSNIQPRLIWKEKIRELFEILLLSFCQHVPSSLLFECPLSKLLSASHESRGTLKSRRNFTFSFSCYSFARLRCCKHFDVASTQKKKRRCKQYTWT